MSALEFEILAQETLHEGFFRLEQYSLRHTLFNGGWSPALSRELYRRTNCVAVLLYDPQRDEVVLIEQFRVGAILQPQRAWLVEIVAGAIEAGETAEDVAYREAEEEAGCQILDLLEIMTFYTTPGGSSERITLFCGRVDTGKVGGIHGLQEEGEDIRVSAVKTDTVFQLLESGKIESGIPIIALQWLWIHHADLRKQWLTGKASNFV